MQTVETTSSSPNSTNAVLNEVPVKRRIKTQQGFSQHILELSEEDAKIYTDLLDRNKIWWADVTNSRY